jgi:glutamine synthetase
VPTVLYPLDKSREVFKKGGVFKDWHVDATIELKMAENARYEMTPHPVAFDMYYSV